MMRKTVVILVDDKKRDLPGCALIAHRLENSFNIRCELQPLEAWRSCLATFKPDYILFNHLTASHLAHFSNRLKEMGVLVGVLPNEGINYDQEALEFNAGRYHAYAHIDQFFCWNESHKNALKKNMNINPGNIYIVGVPRFDFYFEPWKQLFEKHDVVPLAKNRPHILVCTNFCFARYKDLPSSFADRHFSPWKDRVSSLKNYWELIEVNARCRDRFFPFLNAILDGTEYFLDLKPHPREDHVPYKMWYEGLSPEDKKRVSLLFTETIYEVLPLCDLEISCEQCTTALEAWILGKPTIELVFEKYPVFFNEETAKCNRLCDEPEKLPELIKYALENPEQDDLKEPQRRHLERWCASPSGDSSLKVAQIIVGALERQEKPKWDLTVQDWRRAVKLKMKNLLGLAYGSNPWKLLGSAIFNIEETLLESKFIRPVDVKIWKEKLLRVDSGNK
jgi:surface carbohydrate biosynthesis protein